MHEKFIAEVMEQIGEKHVYISKEKLEQYNYDGTDETYQPDFVVEPINTSQVSKLMKLATKYNVPVIPRGTGTGLSGGALAVSGGVILSVLKITEKEFLENWRDSIYEKYK